MVAIHTNAHLRERSFFAKVFQKLHTRGPRYPALPKSVSDRLARDIGLSPNEVERLRFQWPSDGPDHPMI